MMTFLELAHAIDQVKAEIELIIKDVKDAEAVVVAVKERHAGELTKVIDVVTERVARHKAAVQALAALYNEMRGHIGDTPAPPADVTSQALKALFLAGQAIRK